VTVQEAPALRFPPHGVLPLGVDVKYPLPVTLLMSMVDELTFLIVVVFELVVFRMTLPKLWLAGLKVSGELAPFCPVPLIPPTAMGAVAPVAVILSAPLIWPFVVGVKLTA
jgi:hypothetical protein